MPEKEERHLGARDHGWPKMATCLGLGHQRYSMDFNK